MKDLESLHSGFYTPLVEIN